MVRSTKVNRKRYWVLFLNMQINMTTFEICFSCIVMNILGIVTGLNLLSLFIYQKWCKYIMSLSSKLTTETTDRITNNFSELAAFHRLWRVELTTSEWLIQLRSDRMTGSYAELNRWLISHLVLFWSNNFGRRQLSVTDKVTGSLQDISHKNLNRCKINIFA